MKRDKHTVLSSNISWKYITIIWAFCHRYISFTCFCLHLHFFRSFSYEHWGANKPEIFSPVQQAYGNNTMSRTHVFEWHKNFKVGREAVKDDYRSGRPLTSRTKVNVEWVKQVVCVDLGWTVWMIAKLAGQEKAVFRRLSSKIWAYLKSNRTGCTKYPAIPGWEEHRRTRTTFLFSWSCSVRLFSFSQAQGIIKGTGFEGVEAIKRAAMTGTEGYPRRILPDVHRSVAEKDEKEH